MPARAELPKRLRPKRAPSSSAKSIRTRSRGGVPSAPGPGAQHARARRSRRAPRRAAAGGHRIEVGADGQGRRAPVGARQPRPEVAGLVDLDVVDADLGEALAQQPPGRPAIRASSRPGGRPRGRRSASARSRRSASTRAASIAGPASSRPVNRRAPGAAPAPRQWAPPPPSVNMLRSGSKTSMPRARSCSLRLFEYSLESTRSSPSEIALTPSANASATGTSRISNPASRSQRTRPAPADVDADRGQLRGEDREQHVDVDELARDHLDPDLPAELLHPAGELAGGRAPRSAPRRCRSPSARARR